MTTRRFPAPWRAEMPGGYAPSWLTASSTSGRVTTSSKTITFTINSSADKLLPNTYVNSIIFNSTTNSQTSTTASRR
jgi:hypothetical protein